MINHSLTKGKITSRTSMSSMSLSLLSLLILSTLAFCTSSHHQVHHKSRNDGSKSLYYSVYLHEAFNKTSYFIVKGVAGPKRITRTSNPFGSLFVYSDPLTETPDLSSKVVGYAEGLTVTSGFNGERATCVSRFGLSLKAYKGEVLTVGTAHFSKFSELPVVGGTGDFRFVQGYVTSSVVDLSAPAATCFKMEFYLYWPPYAAALAHQ